MLRRALQVLMRLGLGVKKFFIHGTFWGCEGHAKARAGNLILIQFLDWGIGILTQTLAVKKRV